MKNEDFILAINILTMHHSNEIIINHVKPNGFVGDMVNGSPTIHIKNCVPSVIDKLTKNGFSVGMSNGLMTVNKYS